MTEIKILVESIISCIFIRCCIYKSVIQIDYLLLLQRVSVSTQAIYLGNHLQKSIEQSRKNLLEFYHLLLAISRKEKSGFSLYFGKVSILKNIAIKNQLLYVKIK